jgi:hypothetical protein
MFSLLLLVRSCLRTAVAVAVRCALPRRLLVGSQEGLLLGALAFKEMKERAGGQHQHTQWNMWRWARRKNGHLLPPSIVLLFTLRSFSSVTDYVHAAEC